MSWPPDLTALRADMSVVDGRDDVRLASALAAAIAWVAGRRPGASGADVELGTIRLAARLHTRRRSPDGMIDMGEFGAARVGTGDADIDKLLRVGRFAAPVIA